MSRLKESDSLLSLIRSWMVRPVYDICLTPKQALELAQKQLDEHYEQPESSWLKEHIPSMGNLFAKLDLVSALDIVDRQTGMCRRKHVPPTHAELRRVINVAQVHAAAPSLKLVTFDADDTLFPAATNLHKDDWIVEAILKLIKAGVCVSVVTAAGYPGREGVAKYTERLQGLLEMAEEELSDEEQLRLYVMGGECNYLLQLVQGRLTPLDPNIWMTPEMLLWSPDMIKELLDTAQTSLEESAKALNIRVKILRKERAVGAVPLDPVEVIGYELWEDLALEVQERVKDCAVPCCAFNGNIDVFVDVGNKKYGVEALQRTLGVSGSETVHFGDRFTTTGNDVAVRSVAQCLWVANPWETCKLLQRILKRKGIPIEAVPPKVPAGQPSSSTLMTAWGRADDPPETPQRRRKSSFG